MHSKYVGRAISSLNGIRYWLLVIGQYRMGLAFFVKTIVIKLNNYVYQVRVFDKSMYGEMHEGMAEGQ